MSEVDRLEVKVEAQARGANSQLDKLVQQLDSVKNALSGINGSGLIGISNGIGKLAVSMKSMQGVKTTDFTRLTRNIQSIGSINTQNINLAASAMSQITRAFNNMGTVSNNAAQVGELAKSISKLGNKSVVSAITNIPNLSKALVEMMRVLSGAPQVSKNVIDMTNAMASLSANGAKVASTSKNLSTGFKQYAESTRKAKESSKSLAYYIGKLYANYFLLIRATKWLGSAITSSMDYIEEYNYFNVTMEKVASEWSQDFEKYGYESAEAYGDSFQSRLTELMSKMTGFKMNSDGTLTDLMSNNLGLDVTTLANYSAGLMQVTNSLGLTGEASESTSKALSMLAGDMSSFRNLDLNSVMTNFQSGLIGQSRALYKYGIDITNATLANYALQLGLSKSVSEMTQGEKMQLRMIAILDQSKVAWGDLANTINSPSNQLRMFKNNMTALSRTIGNIFLPVVAKVLPYINGLTLAVRRLFTWIGSLLGVDLSGIIGSSSAGYSDAFSDLADDAEDTRSSIDGVSDSANKLKNSLLGFDEINALSSPDTSSNGGGTGSATGGNTLDLTDQLNSAIADYESVWNASFDSMENTANKYADDVVGFFKGIAQYAEPSVDSVKRLWNDGLKKFRDFSAEGAKDFVKEFLIPLGKWTLGKGFPDLVDATNDFLNDINWNMLNRNLAKFWMIMEPFAEGVGNGLIKFYKGITAIGAKAINLVGGAIGGFSDVLNAIGANKIEKLGEAFGVLLGSLLVFKTLSSIVSVVGNVKKALVGTNGFITLMGKSKASLVATLIITLTGALVGFTGGVDSGSLKIVAASLIALSTAILTFKAINGISSIINSFIGSASSGLIKLITFVASNSTTLCISALAGLVAGMVALQVEATRNAPLAKYADDAKNAAEKISSECDSIRNSLESIKDVSINADIDANTVQTLADKYFELADKSHLTNAEQKTLLSLANQLVKEMPELQGQIDLTTGAYSGTKDEIQKIIEKTKESYKLQALQEQYTEYIQKEYKAKKELKDASDKYNDALKVQNQAQRDYNEAAEDYAKLSYSDMKNAQNETVKRFNQTRIALDNAKEATNSYKSAVDDAYDVVRLATDDMDYCWSQMTTDMQNANETTRSSTQNAFYNIEQQIKTSTDNSESAVTSFVTSAQSTLNQLGTAGSNAGFQMSNNFISRISGLPAYNQGIFQQVCNIANSYAANGGASSGKTMLETYRSRISGVPNVAAGAFFAIIDRVNAGSIGADVGSDLMNSLYNTIVDNSNNVRNALSTCITTGFTASLEDKSGYSPGNTAFGISIASKHANGGFPTQGQYFLAREAGPELVGTIGGKNAVVNNPQIVESVSAGVKQAVMEAMFMMGSGSSGDTVVHSHLYIDGEQVAESVNRANENKDGRYNPVSSIG